jgi:hypothetical protein
MMHRIKSDGRAIEARDGYGKTTMFRKPPGTSFRGKATQSKFTFEIGCNVPLLYSRGSVKFSTDSVHFCVAHPLPIFDTRYFFAIINLTNISSNFALSKSI